MKKPRTQSRSRCTRRNLHPFKDPMFEDHRPSSILGDEGGGERRRGSTHPDTISGSLATRETEWSFDDRLRPHTSLRTAQLRTWKAAATCCRRWRNKSRPCAPALDERGCAGRCGDQGHQPPRVRVHAAGKAPGAWDLNLKAPVDGTVVTCTIRGVETECRNARRRRASPLFHARTDTM